MRLALHGILKKGDRPPTNMRPSARVHCVGGSNNRVSGKPPAKQSGREVMKLVRRRLLQLSPAPAADPSVTDSVCTQAAPSGPKLTELLRRDLQGQDQQVQETVVNVLDLPGGAAAPWHMHPGAQELLFVMDGSVTVEIEGQGTRTLKPGEIALIPAEIPHLARNDGSAAARALVTHSRADKAKPFVVAVKRAT